MNLDLEERWGLIAIGILVLSLFAIGTCFPAPAESERPSTPPESFYK